MRCVRSVAGDLTLLEPQALGLNHILADAQYSQFNKEDLLRTEMWHIAADAILRQLS